MIAKLAELNDAGIDEFKAFLNRNKNTPSDEEPPFHLLTCPDHTVPVEMAVGDANVETDTISLTRMHLAERVNALVSSRAELAKICESKGIGAWLSLALFNSICAKKDDGTWKIGQMKRYIDDGTGDEWGFAIHRRNIVCSAIAVYHLHGENARLCLHGPAHVVSDYAEVIGAMYGLAWILQSPPHLQYEMHLDGMLVPDSMQGRAKGGARPAAGSRPRAPAQIASSRYIDCHSI